MYIRISLSFFILALLLYGAYVLYFDTEYNRCVMTYMYELPRYQKLDLPHAVSTLHPKYGLYFYGEGQYYMSYRNAKTLTGIPVLFIPGNAGSHRQVRSMGSVAYRMAESLQKGYYFNYFSVGFNEELSALSGDLLHSQTKFVIHSIQHILKLYKPGISVVIIGHSMGGVIARNLFLLPGFKSEWVHTLITLATPHRFPVLPVDQTMRRIYDRLDYIWRMPRQPELAQLALVSLTGGSRDYQVRDGLGEVSAFAAVEGRSLWLSTNAVRDAWASTDHLCAVWCKQIVMNLNRALFDMVDPSTNQLNVDPRYRIDVFRRHLTTAAKISDRGFERLDSTGRWVYKTRTSHFTFTREEVASEIHIKIGPFRNEDFNAVLIVNEIKGSWLYLCSTENPEDPCREGVDVSSWAQEAPPHEINRHVLHIDGSKFKEPSQHNHYLVVRLRPTNKEIEVFYEKFKASERLLSHDPGLVAYIKNLPGFSSFVGDSLLPRTHPKAFYYRVALPGLYHVRQGLQLKATVLSCSSTAGSVGLISLTSPWDAYFVHASIWYYSNASLDLWLANSRPTDATETAYVELLLDPTCQYKIELLPSLGVMSYQFLRVYAPLLPAYVLMHLLYGIFLQLLCAARGEDIPIIYHVKQKFPIIVASIIAGFFLNSRLLSSLPQPKNDFLRIQEENLWFPLLQQLLFLVAMALYLLLCGVSRLLVELLALPLCRSGDFILCRCLKRLISVAVTLSGLALGLRVCGGLGLLLLLVGQLLLTAFERATKAASSSLHLRFSVLLVLALLSILNAPGVAVWCKEFVESSFKRLPAPVNCGSLPAIAAFAFLALSNSDQALWCHSRALALAAGYATVALAVVSPLFSAFAFDRLSWSLVGCLSAIGSCALVLKAMAASKRHRPKTE